MGTDAVWTEIECPECEGVGGFEGDVPDGADGWRDGPACHVCEGRGVQTLGPDEAVPLAAVVLGRLPAPPVRGEAPPPLDNSDIPF